MYRIKFKNGAFYPQRKGWLFWNSLPRFCSAWGCLHGFRTRKEALVRIEEDRERVAWEAEQSPVEYV